MLTHYRQSPRAATVAVIHVLFQSARHSPNMEVKR